MKPPFLCAGIFALLSTWAWAQLAAQNVAADYPAKPIRIVVPSSPGGGIDALARVIGPKLTETWGKPVVIDNRAGACYFFSTPHHGAAHQNRALARAGGVVIAALAVDTGCANHCGIRSSTKNFLQRFPFRKLVNQLV
jgi:hypothetical protein